MARHSQHEAGSMDKLAIPMGEVVRVQVISALGHTCHIVGLSSQDLYQFLATKQCFLLAASSL